VEPPQGLRRALGAHRSTATSGQLGSLASSRQGLQLCSVQNQRNPLFSSGFAETWHLDALGGKNAAGVPLKSTELMHWPPAAFWGAGSTTAAPVATMK
jgi:hypothetical protein